MWNSSSLVRREFIQYFRNNQHTFLPSSPVVPKNDPTLAFTNAGMNQFKNIFLGFSPAKHASVVNSQKCIRVGGKHNDLDDVGKDGTHHTFFEMLGNWSFNSYFKSEACTMAWELLTEVYHLPPERLFVTYFGGDQSLGLPPDLECYEFWKSLGVSETHILPFGPKENFWEMGAAGPCGPCTEIHYDRTGMKAAHLVNKDVQEVIEIWNLVFMEFQRLPDGTLEKLKGRFVDTGLGLERLVAVLNGVTSNYDTDLFTPIMSTIHQVSGCPSYSGRFGTDDIGGLDTGYRILSDHSRMITSALADGSFPDENHRLRHVIRRALSISSKIFRKDVRLLEALVNPVVDTLGDVYPEMPRNEERVKTLIRYEAELLSKLEKESAKYVKELQGVQYLGDLKLEDLKGAAKLKQEIVKLRNKKQGKVPGALAFQLNQDRGLSLEAIRTVCEKERVMFDENEFNSLVRDVKDTSKATTALKRAKHHVEIKITDYITEAKVKKTDGSLVFEYTSQNGQYTFPILSVNVEAVLVDGEPRDFASVGQTCCLITDETNFYVEAGGQVHDTGLITSSSGKADILSVTDINGRILHHCLVRDGVLRSNSEAELRIDAERRVNIMANHTATHLLNRALHQCLGVTYQKSSFVGPDDLRFEFGVYGTSIDSKMVEKLEEIVNDVIEKRLPVLREVIPSAEALEMKELVTLPGATYPERVSVIRIGDDQSLELCCGTHLANTNDVGRFIITELKSVGSGSKSIRAVTRRSADGIENFGKTVRAKLESLSKILFDRTASVESQLAAVIEAGRGLDEVKRSLVESKLSYLDRMKVECEIERIGKEVKTKPQTLLSSSVSAEAQRSAIAAEASEVPFVVHVVSVPKAFEQWDKLKLPLDKVVKEFSKRGIAAAVICESSTGVLSKTYIPQGVSSALKPESWLEQAVQGLHATVSGGTATIVKAAIPDLVQELSQRYCQLANGQIIRCSSENDSSGERVKLLAQRVRDVPVLDKSLTNEVEKAISIALNSRDRATLSEIKESVCGRKSLASDDNLGSLAKLVEKASAEIDFECTLVAEIHSSLYDKYGVHVIKQSSPSSPKPQLRRLASSVTDRPVLLLAVLDGTLAGVSHIPEGATANQGARDWLEYAAKVLPSSMTPVVKSRKEVNGFLEAQMTVKVSDEDISEVLRMVDEQARDFAEKHFCQNET